MVDVILINDISRIIAMAIEPQSDSLCYGGEAPYEEIDYHNLSKKIIQTVLEHIKTKD